MTSFFNTMDIAASGLTAQRMRMDVIAENIANINTTRTAEGGPYRRRYTVFQERSDMPFSYFLNDYRRGYGIDNATGRGVRVASTGLDQSPFLMDYNPTHPDADAEGYVQMPNVDIAREMLDMMSATRSYEANITAFNSFKDMALKAMEIGK